MTKQEYLTCPICAAQTKDYAENAALTLLHTQATDEMLKMQNRVYELEAEVANLNDWLTTWKESFTLAQAEIAKLKAIAIQWHKYPDEKPIDGRYLFWDSDGNAPHVLPYNDIVVRDNPGVFSTQTHWAYLPAPPKKEEK